MSAEVQRSTQNGVSWLNGPASDLLLGAGVAYLVSVPVILLAARTLDASAWPYFVIWFVGLAINGPHYGATLLRVYRGRDERRKYAFFTIWVSLLLVLIFVGGLRFALVGSIIVTVYFNWSPWHFAGQNYGIAMMFLRRSGISVSPRAKQLLYASFVLSFVLALIAFHVEGSSAAFANTEDAKRGGEGLLRVGIPRSVASPLLFLVGIAYVGSFVAALGLLRRQATLRQLLPVVSLVACQALWFALPVVLIFGGQWSSGRPLAFMAIWISAAHSSQYLWVTLHYERRTNQATRLSTYLLKTTLLGNGLVVLLGVVASPALVGQSIWSAEVALLVFSVVNLHHFILDGAIWKLRDGRVARALLRGESGASSIEPDAGGSRGSRVAIAIVCALCLAVPVSELGWRQAEKAGAYELAGSLLDSLSWFGRDRYAVRFRLGRALFNEGDYISAQRQFELSLEMRPSGGAYRGLGRIYEATGEPGRALRAYESGISLEPTNLPLLRRAGLVQLQLDRPREAVSLLEAALAIDPDHEATRKKLAQARESLEP